MAKKKWFDAQTEDIRAAVPREAPVPKTGPAGSSGPKPKEKAK